MARDVEAAGRAVSARMADKDFTVTSLAKASKVSDRTIRDLISAKHWPQHATRGRLEKALGWPAGRIEDIAEGRTVGGEPQDAAYVSHRGPADQPASISDDDVLAAIDRMARELEDLKKRLRERGEQ